MDWREMFMPFYGGIDTKTDPLLVLAPKLLKLENAIFVGHGGISKRTGYDRIEDSSITTPQAVGAYEQELIYTDAGNLYSYRDSQWDTKDTFDYVKVSKEDVCQVPSEQTSLDTCKSDVLQAFVWEDTRGGVYCSVREIATGVWTVYDQQLASNGQAPRCIAISNQIVLMWAVPSATDLDYVIVNNNAPSDITSQTGTMISDLQSGTPVYDICPDSNNLKFYVAYHATTTNDVKACRVAVDCSVDISVDTGEAAVSPLLITCAANEDYLVVAYDAGAAQDIYVADIEDPESAFIFGGTTNNHSVNDANHLSVALTTVNNETIANVLITEVGSGDDEVHLYQENIPDKDNHGDGLAIMNSNLAAHAFVVNNHCYAAVKHVSHLNIQNGYFLIRLPDFVGGSIGSTEVIAQFGLGNGTPYPGSQEPHLASMTVVGSEVVGAFEVRKRLKLETQNQTDTDQIVYSEIGIADYTFDFDNTDYQFVQVGTAAYASGGLLWAYDGTETAEGTFMLYPEPDITIGATSHTATSVSNTGSMAEGTYSYKIAYERVNARRERIRSFTIPFRVLVSGQSGSGSVTITIPTLAHTRSDIQIVVYRTTDGGNRWFRVSDIDPTNNTGNNRYVDNDTTASTVSFVDGLADADITDNEPENNTGGVLANLPVPACSLIANSKRRVFRAGGEAEPYRVYHSKIRNSGQGLEFNDQLVINVDEVGGPITALATLYDQLVVFKESRIYTVAGDGPNNLGTGGYFEPRAVSTDSGCVNANSVVEMPLGLMFASQKGILLLDRSGVKVMDIGARAEAFDSLSIVSAQLLAEQDAVVFLSSDGTALYYDYDINEWTTFTNHAAVNATIWQNKLVFAQADGDVLISNPDKYLDGGQQYALKLRTAPIRPEGIQGYWRCREFQLVGTYYSEHNLQVDAYYDRQEYPLFTHKFTTSDFIDSATWGSQFTWGSDSVWGGDGQIYKMGQMVHPQKCEVVSFEITELPGAEQGRAFQLAELALRWKPMKGLGRISADRRK